MHKDIEVLQFDLNEHTGVITDIGEIYNKEHIPLGIRDVTSQNLFNWW